MIRILLQCGSALGLTLLLWGAPAFAFEPMPPIMQTLLEVFPEENGRFVDEPFGSTPEMPEEARPLFETFRVVVPSVDDIEKTLARLFAASSRLPIKKITRYDRNPGAPGLPGFRGVWCQTEDELQIGFSIVTINENRFLMWAKIGYYPFFANDSINPKVRDQYARDVSQYLAGLDLKVPDNEAPPASGRGLPEGMDFLNPASDPSSARTDTPHEDIPLIEPIHAWGLSGVKGVIPTPDLMDRIIEGAVLRPQENRDVYWIQQDYSYVGDDVSRLGQWLRTLTRDGFAALGHGNAYDFAVDRFGRVRICSAAGEGGGGLPHSLFFAGCPVLVTGTFKTTSVGEWAQMDPPRLSNVACNFSSYFWAYRSMTSFPPDSADVALERNLVALGHFFKRMRELGVPVDNVLIRKYELFW